jgi:hypothetical protein
MLPENILTGKKKTKKRKKIFLVLFIIFAGIFIYTKIFQTEGVLSHIVTRLIIRSALIIFTWMFIINPILIKVLHSWLERKKSKLSSEIREITLLLPSMQYIISKSWEISSRFSGFKRLNTFFRMIIFNSVQNE